LGNTDEAIRHLEKALLLRGAGLPWIKVFPPYDQLMSDPRYISILERMDLFEKT
jgi:hypothetical protein